jgi:phage shock protein A
MSETARATRLVRRIATAAHQVEHTSQVVTTSEVQLAELRAAVEAMQATIEASFKAQLEAMSFLTRSINDLSTRLGKLEPVRDDVGDDTEG